MPAIPRRPMATTLLMVGVAAAGACACGTATTPMDAGALPADAGGDSATNDAGNGCPCAPPLVCGAETPGECGWGGEPIEGLALYDGWTDPRRVPDPVSTEGWEDSAFVSADGATLYFAYMPIAYPAYTRGVIIPVGPARAGHHNAMGALGPFDLYEASWEAGAWVVRNSTANAMSNDVHDFASGVDAANVHMVLARVSPSVQAADLYLATRATALDPWGEAVPFPAPINTPCIEDNPHLAASGTALYFDSNRAIDAPLGVTDCRDETNSIPKRTIYVSQLRDGAWSSPSRIEGAPNQTRFRWQVFVSDDERTMWWSGSDADCAGDSCIYRAERMTDGSFGNRSLVAAATRTATARAMHDAVGIGEVSITADGRFLYFV